jgi:hypothetical protein
VKLVEARTGASHVHLWLIPAPGAHLRMSLCGMEKKRGDLTTWLDSKSKWCPKCVLLVAALGANGVEIEVS